MQFVAVDILDFLFAHPELFFIALVVIVGALRGLSRVAQSAVKKIGPAGGDGPQRMDLQKLGAAGRAQRARQAGERAPAEPRAAEPVDPEELLPGFLRPQLWDRAKSAGVVEAEPEPAMEAIPVARTADAPRAPKKKRRRKRPPHRHDDADDASTHRLLESSAAATVHREVRRHGQLGSGAPSRADVRRAVLWAEILGPPRGLQPYAPPRLGRGNDPAAMAVVPLPPKSDT